MSMKIGGVVPMATKASQPFEGEPTLAEILRFERLAGEVLAMPYVPSGKRGKDTLAVDGSPIIGMLAEKKLHATVKRYLSEDISTHERHIPDLLADDTTPPVRMVADVMTEGHIFEVQTGSFYPLKKKIQTYLDHTPFHITVVHPMAGIRYLSWINPADGSVVSRTKCRGRRRVIDIAKELFWLSDFIGNPRFSLRLLFLEIEEYRMKDGWSRDGKRGSHRYERFPTTLLGDVMLYEPEDYAFYFLPPDLPRKAPFTAAEYAKITGIRGRSTYGVLHLLVKLGILQEAGKAGRAQQYLIPTSMTWKGFIYYGTD